MIVMDEMVCKEIIDQGEESYQHLEKLAHTLLNLSNEHALHIFDYSARALIQEDAKRVEEAKELLNLSIHGLECFAASIRDEKEFLETFQNADFVVNSVDICIRRLQGIRLNESLSRSVTVIENISNDLLQLVQDLKDNVDLLEF